VSGNLEGLFFFFQLLTLLIVIFFLLQLLLRNNTLFLFNKFWIAVIFFNSLEQEPCGIPNFPQLAESLHEMDLLAHVATKRRLRVFVSNDWTFLSVDIGESLLPNAPRLFDGQASIL